ncbi:MAG: patatin-like phospholipase family protein [Candidatus Zixiibacteriota bacterium]
MNQLAPHWQVKTLAAVFAAVGLLFYGATAGELGIQVGGLDGIDPWQPTPKAQIGLALSGGGARGLSAVGVLQAFEEKGIEPIAITGTSIGGVIGGLYACGYTVDELREIVKDLDINTLIATRPARTSMFLTRRQEREKYLFSVRFNGWRPEIPRAFTGGQEITSLLTRLTLKANYLADREFTRFPIPFKTVGTDIVTGQLVVLEQGSLADAMRATMAFPLAFTGVEKGNGLLMDGGMLMPVPVEVLRPMVDSGTTIVAVNTASPLLDLDDLNTPVDIANQVTSIMTADKLRYQLSLADVVLTPVGEQLSSTDFEDADSLIALGYRAALMAADTILALQASRSALTVYDVCDLQVVCSDSSLANRFRESRLDRPFTLPQLIEDLKTLARTEPVFSIKAELFAECVVPDQSSGAPENTVILRLYLQPQPRMVDITLRFEGDILNDDLSLARLCDFSDSLLSPTALRRAADRIVERYHDDGYDMAEVRDIAVDFDRMLVTFTIDEARVGRINVAENKRTRDWLVRSYLPVARGGAFSSDKAARGLSALYGTELFERVMLDLEPGDSLATMTIRVKERKYSQVRLGWHWHDEYQSEQFIELVDDNVNGVGLEFLTHLQYGPDRQDYHTGLRLDRIFFTYLTARLGFFYNLLDRDLFDSQGDVNGYRDEDRWGGAFYLGQQIARLGQVQAGLRVEEIKTADHRFNTVGQLSLRTLHFESEVESFDRYPFPNSGSKHRFDLRFAGKLLGGDVEFTRFNTSLEAYYTLTSWLNYHPKISMGLSRRGLPPSEKFYLGGLGSFSGYRVNELSGEKMFLLNQELRFKLPFRFYLTGRFDFGDIQAGAEDIKPEEFRQGFGVSLSFDSPIGPFEFGFGGGDSPKDQYYFSAGFRF